MPKKKSKQTKPSKHTNGKPKVRKGIERARYMQEVPCAISESAQAEKARQLSSAYRRREAALEDRRSDMARHKRTLDGIDGEMKSLSDSVENGTELRSVEVVEMFVAETNEVQVVRTDTGEIVEVRTAEATDRQEALFDAKANAARADADAALAKTLAKGPLKEIREPHEDDDLETDPDSDPAPPPFS